MATSSGGYSQPYMIDSQTGRVWRQVVDQDKKLLVFESVPYENVNGDISTVPNETATALVQNNSLLHKAPIIHNQPQVSLDNLHLIVSYTINNNGVTLWLN
jgi:hypothetical protein